MAPADDNPTDFRLPRDAVPWRYELTLAPDLAAASFTGHERVHLEITEPTAVLVLNAAELEISGARLRPEQWLAHGAEAEGDGAGAGAGAGHGDIGRGSQPIALEIVLDPELERATLVAPEKLEPGRWVLECDFAGVLNDKLRGFYQSRFRDDTGHEHVIATTQFEATDARRAFPCWDEPDRKAVFSVTLEVDEGLLALSNGAERSSSALPGGKRRVEFTDTIPMSTYLVAFVVGPLEATEPLDVGGIPIRVVHPPGAGGLTAFALEAGAHALGWFTEYFAQPYPGDKLDLVAIPDFAFGAMENLGCVTFREVALLSDPARSSRDELEHIASIVAHELAHMWFGDLVTMSWWNGIWLNEAFATYMSLCCLDDFRPEYHCWTSFGRDRDSALALDGLHSTRPIEFPVHWPDEADAMFDLLTYEKGGSLLRMLEQYLGTERFRDGVRRYLAAHRFANTETTDLWDAIEQAAGDEPIRALMDSWIFQGGHPLVTARAASDGDGVVLSQEPFAYLPADQRSPGAPPSAIGSAWMVPVATERRPGGGASSESAGSRRYDLLGRDPLRVAPGEGVLVVNAGASGVYRVRYEPELLAEIVAGFDRLERLERFTLVADTWACALAGTMLLAPFLALARRLEGELDPSVWSVVTGALGLIDLAVADRDRGALEAFTRSLLGPELERSGWDRKAGDDSDAPRRRAVLIGALGVIGADPDVRAECAERFAATQAGRELDPDTAAAILHVVAATAGWPEYEALLARYRSPADPLEEKRYLESLAFVRDSALTARTLEMCLGEVRSQDSPYLVRMLLANRVAASAAWAFLTDRWEALVDRFPANSITRMLSGVARLAQVDSQGSPVHAGEVAAFFEAHGFGGQQRQVDQHLERLEVNLRFVQRQRPTLGAELARS